MRYGVDDPVYVGAGSIGVVHDERETLDVGESITPMEGRRDIVAVAGVFLRDELIVYEGAASKRDARGEIAQWSAFGRWRRGCVTA